MEIPNDFRELLELFNVHKVDYLVVRGYALAFCRTSRIAPVRPLSRILALAFGLRMRYC